MKWIDVVTNLAYLIVAAIVVGSYPTAALALAALFAASLCYHALLTISESAVGGIAARRMEQFARDVDRAAVLTTSLVVALELWRIAYPAMIVPIAIAAWLYQKRVRDLQITVGALLIAAMIPLGTKAAVPLSMMLIGTGLAAIAERRRNSLLYEIAHGAWHILSAAAVYTALTV